jgi:hypothetical protein
VPGPDVLKDCVRQLKQMSTSGGRQELKEFLLAIANQEWPETVTIDLRESSEVTQWT